jgi:UDP:flavonoid glycosyltransferase YjiC (YdhE family)
MKTLKKILFVAENVTLAHATRLIVLASAIDQTKYEIIFATGKSVAHLVESAGFNCTIIPTLNSETFVNRLAKGNRIYTFEELKHSVETDLNLIQKTKPDLIIGDFRITLGISAPLSKIPYISVNNAYWSPFSTITRPFPELKLMTSILGVFLSKCIFRLIHPLLFKIHLIPFNKLRKFYGLKPVKSLQEAYTYGDWTLYADIPPLAPTSTLPINHQYIGPVIWSPDMPLPDWWHEIDLKNNPLVYLTLGSSGNIKTIDTILNTLSKMPVTVVVSTANRFEKKDFGENIYFANYLPGQKMAELASLVICSGGSAPVYQALASGTPVIGIPSNMDQHLTMKVITKEGAGLSIRSDQVKESTIKKSLNDILNNERFLNNASRIKGLFDKYHAPTKFNTLIETLLLKSQKS